MMTSTIASFQQLPYILHMYISIITLIILLYYLFPYVAPVLDISLFLKKNSYPFLYYIVPSTESVLNKYLSYRIYTLSWLFSFFFFFVN